MRSFSRTSVSPGRGQKMIESPFRSFSRSGWVVWAERLAPLASRTTKVSAQTYRQRTVFLLLSTWLIDFYDAARPQLNFTRPLKAPLGCGEKEFRCRFKTRQPEGFSRHQSPESAELSGCPTRVNR